MDPLCWAIFLILNWIPAQRCVPCLIKPKGRSWLKMCRKLVLCLSMLDCRVIFQDAGWNLELPIWQLIHLCSLSYSCEISFLQLLLSLQVRRNVVTAVCVCRAETAQLQSQKVCKFVACCTTEMFCSLRYKDRHWFTNRGNLFHSCCHCFHCRHIHRQTRY